MSKPGRLTRREWALINAALALAEVTPDDNDERNDERFFDLLERTRGKVFQRITQTDVEALDQYLEQVD